MTHRMAALPFGALLAAISLTSTGCIGLTAGPALGPLAIPVPVSPYLQKLKEDQFWNHERYERAPILGPLVPGGPMVALDPPSDKQDTYDAWIDTISKEADLVKQGQTASLEQQSKYAKQSQDLIEQSDPQAKQLGLDGFTSAAYQQAAKQSAGES